MVVMNDIIICARDVMKASSCKVESFNGGYYGVTGTVRNGLVTFFYLSRIFEEIDALEDGIISTRRDFHRYAESGWQEFRPAAENAAADGLETDI